MGYRLDDFQGNIICSKCGTRFFKGLKEKPVKCPHCGDPKSDSSASSSEAAKAMERNEELTL